jgi:hypothetical protein
MSEWEDACANCDNEWFWEDCSWMYWRHPCDWENDTDCGWVYWDDWNYEEFWVTCDEFESWDWCKTCDNEWFWEECSSMYWRHPCDWENDTDCGWVYWDDWW